MRRVRALTAAGLLTAASACGGVLGPTPAELQAAVEAFAAGGDNHPGAPDLSGGAIRDFEGCQPLNGVFTCPVIFSTPAGNVATVVWIARAPGGGWAIRNIVPNERPH